jgi:hypothetical protein
MENTIQPSSDIGTKKTDLYEMSGDKDYGVTDTMSTEDERKLVRKIDMQYAFLTGRPQEQTDSR